MTSVVPPAMDTVDLADPYALYARLRQERPVTEVRLSVGGQCWMITRYEDARAALMHPALTKDDETVIALLTGGRPGGNGPSFPSVRHLLNVDPPDHTRLRAVVANLFTTRATARWQSSVERAVADRLDLLAKRDVADLIADFAMPMGLQVLCDMIGIDPADRERFVELAQQAMLAGSREAVAECAAMLERYHDVDGPGMVPQLLRIRAAEPDRLSEVELVSMAFLMVIAGWETTAAAIGNGVLTLLAHPEQQAALRDDPERLGDAVEELFRFESTVNLATMRVSTTELQIGGVTIPADRPVVIAIGSANRDAARFASGDRFDIDASTTGHIAFGYGIHRCLGAPLARLITRHALHQLLTVFPDLELAVPRDQLRWHPLLLRGPAELPVRPGPAI